MVTLRITYLLHDERFDEDYFLNKHMALARDILTPEFTDMRVMRGVAAAGQQPGVRLVAEFDYPSREAMQRAMSSPRMLELRDDVANYTDRRGTISILTPDAG